METFLVLDCIVRTVEHACCNLPSFHNALIAQPHLSNLPRQAKLRCTCAARLHGAYLVRACIGSKPYDARDPVPIMMMMMMIVYYRLSKSTLLPTTMPSHHTQPSIPAPIIGPHVVLLARRGVPADHHPLPPPYPLLQRTKLLHSQVKHP